MVDAVIQTRRLTRYFGSKPAVVSLDIAVPRGCIFGFLGRRKRVVFRDLCEHCDAEFPLPARDGTEIFERNKN